MTTEQIKNRIASLIYRARTRNGWTHYELARRSGVHVANIIRIENGENIPRVDTMLKICTTLNLRIVLDEDLPLT